MNFSSDTFYSSTSSHFLYMQFEYLAELGKEYKKYTGFMVNEQIRVPAGEAVNQLSSEDICLPIENKNSPIILAFTEILKSPKFLKTSPKIVFTMCSVVNGEIIQGNALLEIISAMESAADKMDMESGIKIIQTATSLTKSHIFEVKIFQRILSLVLSLSSNSNEYVMANAHAAFEQILETFIQVIDAQTDELNKIIKLEINEAFHSVVQLKEDITIHEKEEYIYIIINDLLKISKSKPPSWINSHNLSSKMAYSTLEAIFTRYSKTFISHQPLLMLVSRAIEESSSNTVPISFTVNICSSYIETLPNDFSKLFSFHLSQMKQSHQELLYSLRFFRHFILKDQSNIVRFYHSVDKTGELITDLIHSMLMLFEEREGQIQTLHIGFQQNSDSLINTTPIDITCFIIKSLFQTATPDLVDIILKIWSDVLSILTMALNLADQSSSYILLQSLHFLIVLANDLKLDDPRGSAISTVVNIVAEEKMYSEQLRSTAIDTISAAIEGSPQVFNDHWSRIINALSIYKTELSDLSFSLQLSLENIIELELALMYVKTTCSGDERQWALDFSIALLFVNKNRFNDIWLSISENFYDGRNDTADGFINLLNEILSQETEISLCPTLYNIMSDKTMASDTRKMFINAIYVIISEKSTSIKKQWPCIIKSLSPLFYADKSAELVENAFRCLQLLVSDMLFYLEEESQVITYSLVFDFVKQDADINIALSSLTLLWNASSNIKTDETWKHIFNSIKDVIRDQRPDISLAAVKTFFSLIISNSVNLSKNIFNYLTDLFPEILTFISEIDVASQQLLIYETAHCINTLKANFKKIDDNYWNFLLKAEEEFMITCNKHDTTCQGFMFYEEFFSVTLSDEIHFTCFDSLDKLCEYYLEHESSNCVIFGSFGRLIRNILPTRKSADNEEIKRWVTLSHNLIFGLHCKDFLPPTVHKTFDAIDEILPNTNENTETLIKHLVECAAYVENERLTEVSLEHLLFICENKIKNDQLPMVFDICQPLFKLQHCSTLLLHFIDRDIDYKGCDIELFCRSLIEIAGTSNMQLADRACINVLKLFNFTSLETKNMFIDVIKERLKTNIEIWKRFLDPRSSEFEKDVAEKITKKLLYNIGEQMRKCSDEDEIIESLIFIRDAKICESFGQSHILIMLPYLADLVLHPNIDVRLKIREVLLRLTE